MAFIYDLCYNFVDVYNRLNYYSFKLNWIAVDCTCTVLETIPCVQGYNEKIGQMWTNLTSRPKLKSLVFFRQEFSVVVYTQCLDQKRNKIISWIFPSKCMLLWWIVIETTMEYYKKAFVFIISRINVPIVSITMGCTALAL